MNRRRNLLIMACAGAFAAPFSAFGQKHSPSIVRIGFLHGGGPSVYSNQLEALRAGLRDLGYIEGKNVALEPRWAEGSYERLPALAQELVRLNVAVIVTGNSFATSAAREATAAIPIVMGGGAIPRVEGIVESLRRPGGNVTGMTNMAPDTSGKRLELLASVVPKATRIAWLIHPANAVAMNTFPRIQSAGKVLGKEVVLVTAGSAQELEESFRLMVRQGVSAFGVPPDPFMNLHAKTIADLAVRHKLPSMFGSSIPVEHGGLMSYSIDGVALFRQAASYVDKILKGAKPGELPIQQPTRFKLAVNMETAKALGITIPPTVMVFAERIIQ